MDPLNFIFCGDHETSSVLLSLAPRSFCWCCGTMPRICRLAQNNWVHLGFGTQGAARYGAVRYGQWSPGRNSVVISSLQDLSQGRHCAPCDILFHRSLLRR